jgi:hypothetical protein
VNHDIIFLCGVMLVTIEDYWDCECRKEYIHPKYQTTCTRCGEHQNDMPDSRLEEVIRLLENKMEEDMYVSECCGAYPAIELDMSTVKYGGPSGFCGRCLDNCIFVLEDEGEY